MQTPMPNSIPFHRKQHLDRLEAEFDVLVIGGGATGLGVAVDAASRGYRTALIEAGDFASGTSSRSTKLVHGGVRYLAQGRIRLVREALAEREFLLNNAPHLVRPLPFVIPAYAWATIPFYAVGLKMYDGLAGRSSFPHSGILGRSDVIERVPGIARKSLRGGVLYYDGQFDDARLAITLAQTAADHGAVVCNYVRAKSFVFRGTTVAGVVARDIESGAVIKIAARTIINATGVFADQTRALAELHPKQSLTFSRGSHIVLPAAFLNRGDTRSGCAILVPKTADQRVIFAIPFGGHLVVGTTDIATDAPTTRPRTTRDEVEYLLEHINPYLERPAADDDITATFAGIRPLLQEAGKSTSSTSREHSVVVAASGLVTVAGGKWTTYRRMAEDAVNTAVSSSGLPLHQCITRTLRLHGAAGFSRAVDFSASCVDSSQSFMLRHYGSDSVALRQLIEANTTSAEPIHLRLPYVQAQTLYAVRQEMARSVEDVLARRTRTLLLDLEACIEAAPAIAKIIARELGRTEMWQHQQVAALREVAQLAEAWKRE